jgi:hypothetical protein
VQEETLRQFFLGEVDAETLATEVSRSINRVNEIETSFAVQDMEEDFTVTRQHLLQLIAAGLSGQLNEAALNAVAFVLIASDRFDFNEDEVVLAILYDWAAPEINYPLNGSALELNRSWLMDQAPIPNKPNPPKSQSKGKVVSKRYKVPRNEHEASLLRSISNQTDAL